MRNIQIKIAEETYLIVQKFVRINLYQVFCRYGNFEIIRNRSNGKWKILTPDNPRFILPVNHLGTFIEEAFDVGV